jgi:hypothetical protein
MLVQTERENFRLEEQLRMARMVGESLSDHVSKLEGQVRKSVKLLESVPDLSSCGACVMSLDMLIQEGYPALITTGNEI